MGKNKSIVLAIAVILLELLGGMQEYLSQLILPIMATDLNAQGSYGVIMGVSTISSMIGLPIGASLLKRFELPKLLLVLTLVLATGAAVSACAPNIVIYLVGSVIRCLAGASLAMTSIGAVALGLSGRARQLTLAFSSASWVVSSIVGPNYAAWVTHLLSWRWAMLLYLPLLLAARVLVALNLKTERTAKESPFPFKAVLLICVGVLLTIIPSSGYLKAVLMAVGFVLLARVVVILMPTGTFFDKKPRKMALAGMFFLTASYFSANELIGLTAHDVYSAKPDGIGMILLGGGLGWALTGLYCGLKPANTKRRYRVRSTVGLAAITVTSVLISLCIWFGFTIENMVLALIVLWTIAGIGMGITYLDTMNIFFEDPDVNDGISIEEMASSSVIVEGLSAAMFLPCVASILAVAFNHEGHFNPAPYASCWLGAAVLAVITWGYLRNASPATAKN